jgi:gamma-glutamyltranspeptidase / glutathione hydrolase
VPHTRLALAVDGRVQADHGVVAAQHPAVAEVGIDILQAGGNVVDAAVAAVFGAAVADVGRTGIGGYGGHCVYYDAAAHAAWVVDFSTRAPLRMRPELMTAYGPRAVCAPAVVAGMAAAHGRFGSLAWAELLAPAIRLADAGIQFPSPGRDQIFDEAERFTPFPETMRVFVDAWEGHRLRQPDLAATLRVLAREGAAALYRGDIGSSIVRYLRSQGGVLDQPDLAAVSPTIQPAHHCRYRGMDVFTPGAGSGAGVLAPLLTALDRFDLAGLDPLGVERMARLIDATGGAWSDRLGPAVAPPASTAVDGGCTDHLVVADTRGNVASVTTTLRALMGSGVTVPGTGIVLNNALTLFDVEADRPGALAPGKPAVTNMCPTVVVHDGRPRLAIGASGGRHIPSMVAQAATLMLDHTWPGDRALGAPRYHAVAQSPVLVEDTLPEAALAGLRQRGYDLRVRPWATQELGGQAPVVWFEADGGLFGAPDPRRHGGAVAW